jgi:sigma-B regulation protein RsbU (phosphoserine phosphatase)
MASLVCALLLGLVTYADWATGPRLQATLYYFLPIVVASLRFELRGGLTLAFVSAALTSIANSEAIRERSALWTQAGNTLTDASMFALVALVTGALQRQGRQLRLQRCELAAAQQALQEDLRAAELLQEHLLGRPLPEVSGWELAREIRFACGIGGDLYDVRPVGRHLALCVADVSGKGTRAALISAGLKGRLDERMEGAADPLAFLSHLNTRLYRLLPEEMFVTMFYGLLDLTTGELAYASAGHDPPLLCGGRHVEPLPPTAPALGMVPELMGLTKRVTVQPGETLLLYTDGLTTARLPGGGRVGEERVDAWLREMAVLPPAALVRELLCLAGLHTQSAPEDDVALIALRRLP